jgi:hypothetical protein
MDGLRQTLGQSPIYAQILLTLVIQDVPPIRERLAIVWVKIESARIFFGFFGVVAIGLDAFPQQVHPLEKHLL